MKTQASLPKTKKIKIVVAMILPALAWHYRQPLAELLQIIQEQGSVSAYLQGYGPLGPLVLFFLLVAQVFVAVIPGHALMVTAGYVYGVLGLLVTIASTVLGSQLAFLIARRYGRSLIYRLASPQVIERWDRAARHQGILFYFFSFVLPIFPSDLMCYVAGLSTITARRFFIANLLGRTCCAVFITLIGIYGMRPPLGFWIVAVAGIALFFIGWGIFRFAGNQSRKTAKWDRTKCEHCQAI